MDRGSLILQRSVLPISGFPVRDYRHPRSFGRSDVSTRRYCRRSWSGNAYPALRTL